ncbi:hypothetical protein WIS52_21425 [Pseudonocardia nematodicida]|uniref:Uncharacterized protein n=1 Tax=Pseudonocardia nematodicida TaxID=1206997 RepID=A0ABV1KF00_9PSEU
MSRVARTAAYGAAVVVLGAGAYLAGGVIEVPTDHLRPTAEHPAPAPGGTAPAPVHGSIEEDHG